MQIDIPHVIYTMLDRLNTAGFEAFAVGGCVRDSFLALNPSDWDITTNATPEETMTVFNEYRTIPTGIKHGTITVVSESSAVEITTYRKDGTYSDIRRPDFVMFTASLVEDLKRRDFTMNALVADKNGVVTDHFNGIDDIKSKTIRCIGDAHVRFNEDALRILRAIRFASVLGFSLDDDTTNAISQDKALLLNIAPERMREELLKLLCGHNVERVLLNFSEIFAVFLPEIEPMFGFEQCNSYHIHDVWVHTVKAVSAVQNTPILRMATLLHDIGKPATHMRDEKGLDHFCNHEAKSAEIADEILTRLRFSNSDKEQIITLIENHDILKAGTLKVLRRQIRKLGPQTVLDVLEINKADALGQHPALLNRLHDYERMEKQTKEIQQSDMCFKMSTLAIDGLDLLKLGVPEGREVGALLNRLLDDVVDEVIINERKTLLEKANEYIHLRK